MKHATITPDARRWDYHSGVTACETCDGHGTIAATRRATVNDPYPERPCPDCDGEHFPACPVCGNEVEAKGFDCIVCQTVAEMTPAQMRAVNPADLAEAFAAAISAALDERKAA